MGRGSLSRSEFVDAETFALAARKVGVQSQDDIEQFTRLGGEHGELLRAIWGTGPERDAELEADRRSEALARWHCFVEKFPSPAPAATPVSNSTRLNGDEVGEALSAAQFSREQGWLLDLSATVTFEMLGATDAGSVHEVWVRYRKCLSQLFRDLSLPVAFIGVIEHAKTAGLHAHILMNAPIEQRRRIATWHEKFGRRECAERGVSFNGAAIALSRHRKRHSALQDRLLNYALKGADYSAIVQDASTSLDGATTRVGDLLANDFHCPGVVPFNRLAIGASISTTARGDWRSAFERGAFDVGELYDPTFVQWVRRRHRPQRPPRASDLVDLSETTEKLFRLADERAAFVTAMDAVLPNLEAIAHALERFAYDVVFFEAAAFGVSKRAALDSVRRSARSVRSALEVHGARIYELSRSQLADASEIGEVATAWALFEPLCKRIGEDFARPAWMSSRDIDRLALI